MKRTFDGDIRKFLEKGLQSPALNGVDCDVATVSEVALGQEPSTSEETEDKLGRSSNIVDELEPVVSPAIATMDIGKYVSRNLSVAEKVQLLRGTWRPNPRYKFPSIITNGRSRKFNYSWLNEFDWLEFSALADGAFCRYCVCFAPEAAGNTGNQTLGALVRKPFRNWKDAKVSFRTHETKRYHVNAILDAHNFLVDIDKVATPITDQVNKARAEQVKKNRENLAPVVEAIILCGRQELALRGHRDSGPILITSSAGGKDTLTSNTKSNHGNFRAILSYRAQGDLAFQKFLMSSGNVKYTSPDSQNDIIDAIHSVISEVLINRLNKAEAFSVLCDETSDICGIEQISLCVRFYDDEIKKLREDFLGFVPATDLTGPGLASKILNTLKQHGVHLEHLRGQGYDGAAAMSGDFRGVQAIIREQHPMAPYVHCAAHCLNLSVSDACDIPMIRNTLGTLDSLRTFFSGPKRKQVLLEELSRAKSTTHARSLKRASHFRWLERFHAVSDFKELFHIVIQALQDIESWRDRSTSTDAFSFKTALMKSEFVISLLVLERVFAIGHSLSLYLQRSDVDLKVAMDHVNDVLSTLQKLRKNADNEFHSLFKEAHSMCDQYGVEVCIPRLSGRQTHRMNIDTSDPESYYRAVIFLPFLDSFIMTLTERLASHRKLLVSFKCLLPTSSQLGDNHTDGIQELVEFYKYDGGIESLLIVKNQLEIYHRSLQRLGVWPVNAVEALETCDKRLFPSIYRLLQLLATLPVSTATNERSFSTLKRLKTYLRNSTSQNRMNGLALLSIHREIPVSPSDVIDTMSKQKKRRVDLVL